MSSKDGMTDAFVSDSSEKGKKPIVFAGNIFYRHLHDSLKLSQAGMLTRNYEQWIVVLLDLNSKLSPFMIETTSDNKDLNIVVKECETPQRVCDYLETKLQNCLTRVMNNGKVKGNNSHLFLLKELLSIQKTMFTASAPLFLGMTDKADNEFEQDQEDGG